MPVAYPVPLMMKNGDFRVVAVTEKTVGASLRTGPYGRVGKPLRGHMPTWTAGGGLVSSTESQGFSLDRPVRYAWP